MNNLTAYDEISTSRRLNRKFWNDDARFIIAMIRVNKRANNGNCGLNCIRALKKSLKQRAEFEYLEAGL
jgi:hypothetical protein